MSGDFNVNTADVLSCNSQTIHDFINTNSSFHYHKLINQPTRIILHKNSIKTATLIDNIYTNSTNWETSTNGILHSDLNIYIYYRFSPVCIRRCTFDSNFHVRHVYCFSLQCTIFNTSRPLVGLWFPTSMYMLV